MSCRRQTRYQSSCTVHWTLPKIWFLLTLFVMRKQRIRKGRSIEVAKNEPVTKWNDPEAADKQAVCSRARAHVPAAHVCASTINSGWLLFCTARHGLHKVAKITRQEICIILGTRFPEKAATADNIIMVIIITWYFLSVMNCDRRQTIFLLSSPTVYNTWNRNRALYNSLLHFFLFWYQLLYK